ncbi:enoyl-CoA hydratase-related protein [Chitinophaga sedimenti]|uniref:enoyl-CoA hydratase/isomerase family protein n=1 Tax=Chitinophaga sedimenti TaxID=2033606 RepID=UPI00200476FB|nr:enoyl-CoA hydratase-related protein [Chitinophaga sedimenti]MCK7559942.1 enoyl-CoA hydratase-related protein [Chitinophaga sedimenti]
MSWSFITYEVVNRIATITLNRPDKRNALNDGVVKELIAAFTEAGKDSAVKVIVLAANGEAFCVGADLEYLQQLQRNTYEENLADSRQLMELMQLIYSHEKTVIARIEGHAIAGGCGLATVCDLSYAVPDAKFGYTEVKIGFVPALVSVFLVRKIGEGRARALMLTGKLISAEQAVQMGLINGVAAPGQIHDLVQQLAEDLCTGASANSLSLTKKLVANALDLPMQQALEEAAKINALTREHPDCREGIRAFLHKEKPGW